MRRTLASLGLVILISCGVLFTGCVEQQKPVVKTPEELAVEIVTLLEEKNYAGVYSYFNSSIATQITAVQFEDIWNQQVLANYGNLTRIVSTRLANESGYPVVYVTCNFSKQPVMDVKIMFNQYSNVIALTVVPTSVVYTPPVYVNQSAFTELNVTVGSGEWALPGILSVPNGAGPFPAVVLVQGSGPNDQDETIGPNKPFKDLAWSLASRGVVVLRYVKRTKEYPQKSMEIANFTVEDEVVDDAIAAVSVLNGSPVVNHSRMFLLGHSLGGMLAPRIASQDYRIAGIIIMAGPTRPLEDLILEQTRYLANLSGTNQSVQIAALERNVTKIKTLNFTDNEFILGAPKSYWADLATYDPVATAETLHIPMLIVQGLRDYQVTREDFTRWNSTFAGNPAVTLKTYLSLNHLFISGTGTPTNAEYLIPGHVAEQVVSDIATWIQSY
jgi:dienelactone hydrolase